QPSGLGLGRQTLPVLLGKTRGVGVEALLERDDLFADEATDLLAQDAQLVGQREAGEHGCHSITWSAPTVTTAGWYRRSLAPSHRPRGLDKRALRPRLVSTRAAHPDPAPVEDCDGALPQPARAHRSRPCRSRHLQVADSDTGRVE